MSTALNYTIVSYPVVGCLLNRLCCIAPSSRILQPPASPTAMRGLGFRSKQRRTV